MQRGTLLCLAALFLVLPALSSAQQIAIGEYALPAISSFPEGIAVGADGALWFAENFGNRIGRITTAGAITEYSVPTPNSAPENIAAGPDGALWFTEFFGNKIGRITTAGVFTEYPVPTPDCLPLAITAGPDGALWFTEGGGVGVPNGNKIGRITTAGVITEYPVPTPISAPIGITAGSDGALWFVEGAANQIGRLTTAGTFTEYAIPTLRSGPYWITSGPDGALWFTEVEGGKIGRITTSGAITEFPCASEPTEIATGPDGALWFTQGFYTQVGRMTTAGVATNYPLPQQGPPSLFGITTGPEGEMWFTNGAFGIGEIVFETANLSVSPDSGAYRASLTFSGSGFAPHENVLIYKSGAGSAVLAGTTADSNGMFAVAASEPASRFGPRIYIGTGQTSGKLGAAALSVTPRLELKPDSGLAGSGAVAAGFGFGTSEKVNVYWDGTSNLLGSVTANVYGSFSFTFKVPVAATPGAYTVTAVGQGTNATGIASFSVE